MHGLGNDFIVADAEGGDFTAQARALCDRHRGIGGDGLILLLPPTRAEADLCMRMFNPDGSEAEMCGNGIRCLAGFARARFPQRTTLRIETGAGLLTARLIDDEDAHGIGFVEIDMGPPRHTRGEIPMDGPPAESAIDVPLPHEGHVYTATCVSMGNPHCVLFLDAQRGTPLDGLDLAEVGLDVLGPQLERHPAFPRGANVEVATLVDRDEIHARVWERGAGLTLACGTGACATMVAAALTARVGRKARVVLPGGPLEIAWEKSGSVFMTGPYQRVFHGTLAGQPQ
ncbi:MAG: diaminopimelate epimerase [Armatimonadetes bacterium]|nr:diaminopimelate epimerase [Armatimonadota bacterium]